MDLFYIPIFNDLVSLAKDYHKMQNNYVNSEKNQKMPKLMDKSLINKYLYRLPSKHLLIIKRKIVTL